MARARRGIGKDGKESLTIRCPGCDDFHVLTGWTWNGDLHFPSFMPSLLVRWRGEDEGKLVELVCHSYITSGKIRFLEDCTHSLRGQTVDLPELE